MYKEMGEVKEFTHKPNIGNRRVFTSEQETELASYLVKAAKISHGLTAVQTRTLAYEYALLIESPLIPDVWKSTKQAGYDWLKGFMKRSGDLSLRTPEPTSLSRATSFNALNVRIFYEKLAEVMNRYKFTADRIYNADETGITTVHKPPKTIAKRGQKQVSQITSGERGQLVTMLCIVNAIGNTLPPVFIFPRTNYKEFMLHGAPPQSLGLAYKTGWMTCDNFLAALKHLAKYSFCTLDNPILLLIDNSETHISVEIIKFSKENGIVILTFTPHCSHRMQPLDVSVFGPFKGRYNAAANNWMITNPGKTITIYNVAELAGIAFSLAFTRSNIQSGFHKSGIYPFNKEIFTEEDFLSAYVTDRPNPIIAPETSPSQNDVSQPGTSKEVEKPLLDLAVPVPSSNDTKHLSIEVIRPYPKAAPRKACRGRKK
ncbi:uncharacterized protein LOC129232748, partial [Uloborus diversus]|uniref:uncharacterized protein LOC129232748 n=1 Tax=Uloborus diversus TaxID=327109 RepID=UPI0024097404